jgi:hypothetical protein
VLSLISIVITTLFLIEIPLSLFALGSEFYNPYGRVPHASLHLFDAVIIVTTFVLEVILRGKERELAGLLVVLRLWRLLKLVGGESDSFFFFVAKSMTSTYAMIRRCGRRRRDGGRHVQEPSSGEKRVGRFSFRARPGPG